MGSPKKNENKGFFAAMTSGFSVFSNAMHRSVNGYFTFTIPYFISDEDNLLILYSHILNVLCLYHHILYPYLYVYL